MTDFIMNGNLQPTLIDPFEPNQCAQQVKQLQQRQHFPICPTTLQQHTNSKAVNNHLFYNCKNFKLTNFQNYF